MMTPCLLVSRFVNIYVARLVVWRASANRPPMHHPAQDFSRVDLVIVYMLQYFLQAWRVMLLG
jgi:hypothetical protein